MDVYARTISPRGTRWARGAPPPTSSAISRFIRARRSKTRDGGPSREGRPCRETDRFDRPRTMRGRKRWKRGKRRRARCACGITPRNRSPSRSVFTVVSWFTRDTSGVSYESSLMTTLCATLSSLRVLFVVLFVTFPSETRVPVPGTRMPPDDVFYARVGRPRAIPRLPVVRSQRGHRVRERRLLRSSRARRGTERPRRRERRRRRIRISRVDSSASATSSTTAPGRFPLAGTSTDAASATSSTTAPGRFPLAGYRRRVLRRYRRRVLSASRHARHRLGSLYFFFFRNSRSPAETMYEPSHAAHVNASRDAGGNGSDQSDDARDPR